MGLAGDLSEITFSEVVQLYSQTRRTATLLVNSAKTRKPLGYFYFERGELFDAKLEDAEGLEAVYRALRLSEGTFHVVTDTRRYERRIFEPVHAMLLEGMRRMDEAERQPALKLVRPDDSQGEGEDMATGESRGRICPTCKKRFKFGEICPDDGARLEPLIGASISVDTPMAPERTVSPPPALNRRRVGRGWWVMVAGLAVVAAMAVVWMLRGPRSIATVRSRRPPTSLRPRPRRRRRRRRRRPAGSPTARSSSGWRRR